MENDIVKNLIEEITSLEDKIRGYIENTENWIFYWIDCKEVQKFVEAYPEDYKIMANVSIIYIHAVSASVRIDFDEHPDDIESIEIYAHLPFFRRTTNANWLKWNGKIQELQRLEIEKELQFHKRRIAELESELK